MDRITVRIDPDLIRQVKAHAKDLGLSVSKYVEMRLRAGLIVEKPEEGPTPVMDSIQLFSLGQGTDYRELRRRKMLDRIQDKERQGAS